MIIKKLICILKTITCHCQQVTVGWLKLKNDSERRLETIKFVVNDVLLNDFKMIEKNNFLKRNLTVIAP